MPSIRRTSFTVKIVELTVYFDYGASNLARFNRERILGEDMKVMNL